MSLRGTLFLLVVLVMSVGVVLAGGQRSTAVDAVDPADVTDHQMPVPAPLRAVPHSTEGGVLYDNGPLITHPGGGSGGADASAVQNTTFGLTVYGFAQNKPTGFEYRLGDDFTVSDDGWTVDALCFYGYQTGSSTTSTFTAVKWWIYDGDPGAGGTVICTDSATIANGRLASSWSGIYRTLETDVPTATTRPIMLNECTVSPACVLSAGTYWVVTAAWGTLTSGPWGPPISILGTASSGDGIQYQTGIWADMLDVTYAQGLPFLIKGTVNADVCADYTNFLARCTSSGLLQARVVLRDNIAHSGETVMFQVDEDVYPATIGDNGTSSRASMSITSPGAGDHTVSLIDPDGCFPPIVVTCLLAKESANQEWEADDARWAAESRKTEPQAAPTATKLLGNYPNPFNPATAISYQLSADNWVSLKIYNTLGEEVAALVDEFQTAGVKSATWNGRNNAGSSVASGIYIYRLTTGNVVKSEKMMFMK